MPTENIKAGPPLLEVRELSLSFHDPGKTGAAPAAQRLAIDRISFSITAGSTLGLVGASGAGKSSIARAIMRLVKPDAGEILFNGDNILDMAPGELKAIRRRVQLVFQNPSASLSPRRSVAQTLLEPLEHFAMGDAHYRHERVEQTLQTVGLGAEVLQRFPHQFSSGQQQRIAIARALVTDPDLLIADEAVSSLDVSVQAQILQLIQSLQQRHGIAFLFISHDLAVIRQIADQVAVMYGGQILENSPADHFFSRPAHPYSQALLAFAGQQSIAQPVERQLRLIRGRDSSHHTPACVYADGCADRMAVCQSTEPGIHQINYKNRNMTGQHCVKCHLYGSGKTHDS